MSTAAKKSTEKPRAKRGRVSKEQQEVAAPAETTPAVSTSPTVSTSPMEVATAAPAATPAWQTNPEFLVMLVKMSCNQIPVPDGKIFVAQRADKVVDVWKVRKDFFSVVFAINLVHLSNS